MKANALLQRLKHALKPPREPVAEGTLLGVRQVWTDSIANGLTPQRLASLIDSANRGDAYDFLTLAEEMEERDPHYAAVLGTRKRAVSRLENVIEAASDSAHDVMLADQCRRLVKQPAFTILKEDLLDALGKGYSACAPVIDHAKTPWVPTDYLHRDPRWFQFDRITLRELRIRDEANPDGVPIDPGTLIVHIPRLKSGLPLRGSLARMVAFAWICKAYAQKDWLAFAEVFGLPLRVGKYDSNASRADKSALRRAVASLGVDAAAIMPKGMEIEFIQAGNITGGADLFKNLCEYLDKQVSKAVLGQTMTTDDGASLSQAKVHNEVRRDILEADAEQLEATINRDLIRPFIIWNWGVQENYPEFKLHIAESEDLTALSDNLVKLVPLGLRVEQSVIRDKLGLPDPDEGAELLGPAAAETPALNRSMNRKTIAEPSAASLLANRLQIEGDVAIGDWVEAIRAMADEATSLPDLRDRLLDAFGDLPSDKLSQVMAAAISTAGLVGKFDQISDVGA